MSLQPEYKDEEEQERQGGLANSLGLIIFLLAIGSQFLQPVLAWLGQFIGAGAANRIGSTLPSLLPIIIVGLVLLSIVWSVGSAVARGIGGLQRGSEPNSPMTSLPQTTPYSTPSTSVPYSMPKSDAPMPFPGQGKASVPPMYTTPHPNEQSYAPDMEDLFPHSKRSEGLPPSYNHLPRAPLPGKLEASAPSRMLKNGTITTPSFEPIIDSTVLTYGILASFIGLALLGGLVVLIGMLP
ncbi:MAG: hypothetical protein HC911_13895 [Chloroflexaceae bacterium]|nr:hypothetical protein [Chloroflexaceae bacterium]